ncbi:hypothetical protein EN850_16080 [Mesorhizobium sp. M8A.F.Ca.ET.207.01.1.1]|uniref:hypothetical protein n=1 Tax=Mesorhizobium sp. M8A.F.Ca.ET.207.01.1.1 TaxID=2563968 RepID=UPI00109D46E0|nr:hypothetical protein [Mesorhizobium sp. M8A.F.Ca.ET.207.01.1.1]TGQ79586.1 hypothetical protein EN850_16080 [Mesorhizobium sp. M8A.F.Ca.ET.207.01.1.1]
MSNPLALNDAIPSAEAPWRKSGRRAASEIRLEEIRLTMVRRRQTAVKPLSMLIGEWQVAI